MLKGIKPGKCGRYKSTGSTGGVQDREWLDLQQGADREESWEDIQMKKSNE